MKPTRLITLLSVAALDGFVALIATDLFARSGRPIFIAPATLVFTLPAIAILLGVFGWPMLRYRRDLAAAVKTKQTKPVKRVDPFYAVRILMLAKASSIASSAILGWQLGLLFYVLTRPAQNSDAVTRTIAAAAGALILLVVALVVERICRLPNDGSSPTSDEPEAAA